MGVNVFAKGIGPCQPARSAQADMGRNFSLSLHLLHVKEWFCISSNNRLFDEFDFMDSQKVMCCLVDRLMRMY